MGTKTDACVLALFKKAASAPNQKLLLIQPHSESDRTYTFPNGSSIYIPANTTNLNKSDLSLECSTKNYFYYPVNFDVLDDLQED